jgi:arylsulfatase A-like enzyme
VDAQVARLLSHLDREFGRNATLVVLTADHGVAPLPGARGGRISEEALTARVNAALGSAYGGTFGGSWVAFHDFPNLWLNEAMAMAKGVSAAEAARVARDAVAGLPGIKAAYTREELLAWGADGGAPPKAGPVLLSFHPERSGDVVYQVLPFQVVADSGSNHGSHWRYDSHVPLMWLGPGIRPGSYHSLASAVDIAPTLLTLLELKERPATDGCVLSEALTAGGPPCDRPAVVPVARQAGS